MTPKFADAVDPVFASALEVLEQIEDGAEPDPEIVRRGLLRRLEQAEAKLGATKDWEHAKYALVVWIDEILIDAPWKKGQKAWENHCLEVDVYPSKQAASEFFDKANEASALVEKDALEVYYLAVILGFRGIYRDTPTLDRDECDFRNLPATRGLWARRISKSIQVGQGRPNLENRPEEGRGGEALHGRFELLGSLLWFMLLLTVCIVLAFAKIFD